MKQFAIYLPQFHEIEDNNRWWGKGFTEWTNVKTARPLYRNHIQPIHPLDGFYYDLSDPKTNKWQIDLAKRYGIDGFIYYHYYFSGKMIMQRPAEAFLNNKELDHRFFFCWANHTWYKGDGDHRETLIKQTYGDKGDWEKHFKYLLPFFKDSRYEKKNNKPVFMIYVYSFDKKVDIINYFDQRCKDEGFNGIFIIETYTGDATSSDIQSFSDKIVKQAGLVYFREPNVAMRKYFKYRPMTRLYFKIIRNAKLKLKDNMVLKINGSKLFRNMSRNLVKTIAGCPVTHGLYFSWDNTPRHGNKGYVISMPDKRDFETYVKAIQNDEYLIINAWNEWAEGMVMEPTEEYGYRNLEWLSDALSK